VHPLNVMLRYRDLLVVEQLFRSEQALLANPTDLSPDRCGDPRARVLQLPGSGVAQGTGGTPERRAAETGMADVAHGKHFILRTPVTGVAGKAFQAVGTALPPNIREAVRAVTT
jgi:hypothetical protein